MDGWMEGWFNGSVDGWMDGEMEGWTDQCPLAICYHVTHFLFSNSTMCYGKDSPI